VSYAELEEERVIAADSTEREWAHDAARLRLRDWTDYVYQMITKDKTDPN